MPHHALLETPVGTIIIEATEDWLTRLYWATSDKPASFSSDSPLLGEARKQLSAYFKGTLHHFDLPLAPTTTARGMILREAIAAIPYGTTTSYASIAKDIGSAPRAIGQACARNAFPVIIPCHRVLPAGGLAGNYSAGNGSDTKIALLRHENTFLLNS